jgi:hypothetical protein
MGDTLVHSSVKQHKQKAVPPDTKMPCLSQQDCAPGSHHVIFSSFLSLFYLRLGSAPPDFCVFVFSFGIISATYSITDLHDGNYTRQRLASSCLSCTRTLPLYWTSGFHSLEHNLFFSRKAFSPTAEHTSWTSVVEGFSTALLMGIRLPSAMVLLFK